MTKFICRNEACKKFGVEDEYTSLTYKVVNGHLQATVAPCPCCGEIREEINPNKDIPLSEKNISIGKYASASKEQKTEMLKKRSHDHYEKTVKPFKEHQLNEAMKQMKEYKKTKQ
nr:MAG TPA: restriction alleviation protein [Caudoviricetes sp.]